MRIRELFGKTIESINFEDAGMLLAETFTKVDTTHNEIEETMEYLAKKNGWNVDELSNTVYRQMSIKKVI